MFVYPEFLLTNIYRADYSGGASVLRILALRSIANSYFGFYYHTIMASWDSNLLMKCSLVSAGMNVLLNFMFVPQYGIIRAAVSFSLSFSAIEIFMTFKIWKKQNMPPFALTYRRLTVIGILMVAIMLTTREELMLRSTKWEFTAFIVLCFAVILYARILDENEMDIIGEIRKDIRYFIGVRMSHLFRIYV